MDRVEVGALVEIVRLGEVISGIVIEKSGGVCRIEVESPMKMMGKILERGEGFLFREVLNP
jgi:hypothetical protein